MCSPFIWLPELMVFSVIFHCYITDDPKTAKSPFCYFATCLWVRNLRAALLGDSGSEHPVSCSKSVRQNCSHLKVLGTGKFCFQGGRLMLPLWRGPDLHVDPPKDSLSAPVLQQWFPQKARRTLGTSLRSHGAVAHTCDYSFWRWMLEDQASPSVIPDLSQRN